MRRSNIHHVPERQNFPTIFNKCDPSSCSTSVIRHLVQQVWSVILFNKCDPSSCSTSVIRHLVQQVWSVILFNKCDPSSCSTSLTRRVSFKINFLVILLHFLSLVQQLHTVFIGKTEQESWCHEDGSVCIWKTPVSPSTFPVPGSCWPW